MFEAICMLVIIIMIGYIIYKSLWLCFHPKIIITNGKLLYKNISPIFLPLAIIFLFPLLLIMGLLFGSILGAVLAIEKIKRDFSAPKPH